MAITRSPLLTRRALILAKIESTYNIDPTPSVATDSLLVEDPSYAVDPNVLERNFVRDDLSPLGARVGRKLASLEFGVELRSNGLTNAGTLGSASLLGRLLRACGYSETAVASGVATMGTVRAATTNTSPTVTFTPTVGNSTLDVRNYRISVVLGGASATAKVRVTEPSGRDTSVLKKEGVSGAFYGTGATMTVAVNQTNPLVPTITIGGSFNAGDAGNFDVNGEKYELVATAGHATLSGYATALATLIDAHALITATPAGAVVTLGYAGTGLGTTITTAVTAINLGNSSAIETPAWSGSLILNDYWTVLLTPVGLKYLPVSTGFESMTLYAYFDGKLQKLTGCFGTFTFEAEAGMYAKAKFKFTGQYVAPVDADLPAGAVYETAVPPMVELAKLNVDGFDAVVNAISYDQQNTIVPRPDVNMSDGYNGVRITARSPQGGIDPEDSLVRDYDWWTKMAQGTQVSLSMRFGQTAGNIVWMYSPLIQYTGLTYQDRDGLKVYDASVRFTRDQGNDEVMFFTA